MIYKQYESDLALPTISQQILYNRGISVDNIEKWINASIDDINSPWDFGKEKVKNALKLIDAAMLDNRDIWILVDCDADGFTSAAIIINFLYKFDNELKDKIHYILHTGKQHGLEDTIEQFPEKCYK